MNSFDYARNTHRSALDFTVVWILTKQRKHHWLPFSSPEWNDLLLSSHTTHKMRSSMCRVRVARTQLDMLHSLGPLFQCLPGGQISGQGSSFESDLASPFSLHHIVNRANAFPRDDPALDKLKYLLCLQPPE
jgi:hypothetical protein